METESKSGKPTSPETKPSPKPFEYQLNRRQLLRAAGVGSALVLAKVSTALISDNFGVSVGSSGTQKEDGEINMEDYLANDPVAAVAMADIVGPLWEETLFRALPSLALDANKPYLAGQYVWKVAIPTSTLFALAHGIRKGAMLVPHLISGLVFWKMAREGGLPSAFVAHSTHNTLLTSAIIMGRIFGFNK